MSTGTKPQSPPTNTEEDRLAIALINRALVTPEEVDQCRGSQESEKTGELFLNRLVKNQFLTATQAKRVAQEMALFVGQQIPGYQLLEKLGQGSMGTVFKARQLSMNRLVAIKVLHPKLAANPKELDSFLQEAQLAAKLCHNNIVQGIDAGSAGKIHYFVMEYLEGTNIHKQLESGKIYSEKEAIETILQIAEALEHANRRHLIHRDIKPGNIVITQEGVAKLADLGLALHTAGEALSQEEKGTIRGTPFYIAPEQIQNREDIDIRADIYSLGATLYHMVTGQPPFIGKKIRTILEAHLHQELTPPDHLNTSLSSGLGEVVEFMMAKKREKGYPTPRELIQDLESLLVGEPPKFARQRIESSVLQDLAKGEEAADEDEEPSQNQSFPPIKPIWLIIASVLLGLSLVVNLILILRRNN